MRRLTVTVTCVLAAWLAAGGVQAQQRVEEARRGQRINDRLELRYTLEVEEDDERNAVAVTDGFESGGRFTLRVRPTQDAYLYLFASNPNGEFTLVAPEQEGDGSLPRSVEGGTDVRLPAGSTLVLDEEPGVERLYLLASRAPLDEVDDLLEVDRPQVRETWLIDLRDLYARNGTVTRQVRNEAVRIEHRQRGRGTAVVFETLVMRHYSGR